MLETSLARIVSADPDETKHGAGQSNRLRLRFLEASVDVWMFAFLPALTIVGGMGIVYLGMHARMRQREMIHRERLAMIEKGLAPPPESDPAHYRDLLAPRLARLSNRGVRFRSAGIMFIGFGLGLMVLLIFTAGEPAVGIGVGGAFIVLGLAFLINSAFEGRSDPPTQPSGPPV
jgi:hypothetical protein